MVGLNTAAFDRILALAQNVEDISLTGNFASRSLSEEEREEEWEEEKETDKFNMKNRLSKERL